MRVGKIYEIKLKIQNFYYKGGMCMLSFLIKKMFVQKFRLLNFVIREREKERMKKEEREKKKEIRKRAERQKTRDSDKNKNAKTV